jgi:hypothetical protein
MGNIVNKPTTPTRHSAGRPKSPSVQHVRKAVNVTFTTLTKEEVEKGRSSAYKYVL